MSNVRVSFTSTTSSQGTTVASEHHLDCGGERKSNHHHNSKQAFKLDDVDGTPFLDEARPFGDSVDPDETEEEEGVVVLHKLFGRKVSRHGNVVVKWGKSITAHEADALRLAERLRLPAPRVHSVERDERGNMRITMDYVEGDVLEDMWPNLTDREKKGIARQLRAILYAMRAAPPPTGPGPGSRGGGGGGNSDATSTALVKRGAAGERGLVAGTGGAKAMIGSCGGGPARDAHYYFDYDGGPFDTEEDFNKFLLSTLLDDTPPAISKALARRLRTDHRIVFTHGDLTLRNIVVRDGRIVALLDWEYAGWYPEYWEYVKFLGRFCRHGDWRACADDIFPVSYADELVDYVALNHWQRP